MMWLHRSRSIIPKMKFNLTGLKKEFITPRTNDEVHQSIELCPITKLLVSTPQMQRLRQLKQLGTSIITYVNTTHTRFEHSLGVMHISDLLLRAIRGRQPRLGITDKDIVCVKIAGLLHDLGHGPFSHVYDGIFRKQLKQAQEKGEWLGHKFDTSAMHDDLPEVMDGWAHEDASLMMVDGMLKGLGLEIDESNLDEPLLQIGNGIDARTFGIWDRKLEAEVTNYNVDESDDDDDGYYHLTAPLPNELVLTSRDWIFIKECIVGGPLPPKGMSIEKFKESGQKNAKLIGRPHPHKAFLYTIVCNRQSGFDTDKWDYLARDSLKAHGSNCIADLLAKMVEKAFVAWGKCADKNCHTCRQYEEGLRKPALGDRPGEHLMICYPDNMVQNMMSFFEQRYKEHQRLYTHSKTQRGNFQICDILLLAEPHFRVITINDGDDINAPRPDNAVSLKLPISHAMVNADAYLELTDNVLEKIMQSDNIELRPARILIKQYRGHQIYERIHTTIINDNTWTQKLWDMSEADIVGEVLKLSVIDMSDNDGNALSEDDIIVERRKIHHGMKEKNPVDFMRFLPTKKFHRQLLNSPQNLPTAVQLSGSSYRKPDIFLQKSVRVFCRSSDFGKRKQLKKYYEEFINSLQDQESDVKKYSFEVDEYLPQTPTRNRNPIPVTQESPPSVTQTPTKYDTTPPQFDNAETFLDRVKKRSRND